jgi:hypothetical protein
MASLRDLPFPGGGIDNEIEDDNRSTSSWDSTYQQEPLATFSEHHRTLCPHAVSVGSTVFGVKDFVEQSSIGEAGKRWWTWQRSLEHVSKQVPCSAGSINSIASNANGTVIAATTDAGVVALLRGSDGVVLATRNVCSSDRLSSAIRLTWISCPPNDDDPCDSLLMEVPIGTEDDIESSNCNSQLIVVTNIHGLRLNHSDSAIVSEAARSTQIVPIPMKGTLSKYDLRAITACRSTTADIVRIVACDADSQLVVFDFHCITQELQLIEQGISLGVDAVTMEVDRWINFELGLYATMSGPPLVLCSALLHSKALMLFWFNSRTMQTACQFVLPNIDGSSDVPSSPTGGSKVMAVESVSSWSDSDVLAYAVAVKPIAKNGSPSVSSATNIHIVQVLLDEILGLTVVYCPHLLYTIPIQEPIVSITLSAVQTNAAPFSFRFHIWNRPEENLCVFKEFQPNISSGKAIGQVRSLIHRKDFDRADALIASIGVDALITEPFANFHPSEVAFHRLHLSWQDPSNNDAEEETQLCLRQLASGAIASGTIHTKAFDLLIDAMRLLTNESSSLTLSFESFIRILEMVALTLRTVMESMPTASRFEIVITSLDAILRQIAALNVFRTISSRHRELLVTPFFAIRSIHHLYEICTQEHQFVLAEAVYQCSRNDVCWSASSLVKPLLLNVRGSDVKPKDYLFVICDVIFPNLSLSDANLAQLKLWCCQMADSLDDTDADEANLDAAVLLLETVDKEIRQLRLRSYASYRHFFPNDRSKGNDSRLGTIHLSAKVDGSPEECEPLSKSRLHKIKSAIGGRVGNKNGPLPTILELSALQRGSSIVTDDDSVHDKLFQAKCLQKARSLGLTKEATPLRSFSLDCGPERLAKDLGCFSLTTPSSKEHRAQFLAERIQPFCEQFSIDFDQILHDCAVEICCGKSVSSRSIDGCCSIVRCCSSRKIRCKITLIILRAALSCGGANEMLLQLSREAISSWASSSSIIHSELEEAFRLLQIDGIVIRYCGTGARELFRVENPRHSIRLLHFVTQHVDIGTVVDDMMALCDAFNHLCRRKACRQLLENAILHCDSDDFALHVFQQLIKKNYSLAESSLFATVGLAEFIFEECSVSMKAACQSIRLERYSQRASSICSRIGTLIMFALENGLSLSPGPVSFLNSSMSLQQLNAGFTRIQRLQSAFRVYPSMDEMAATSAIVNIVVDFIGRSLPQICSGERELSRHKLSLAKRVCSLLTTCSSVDEHDLWIVSSAFVIVTKAKEWNDKFLTRFIVDVALLSDVPSRVRSRACMSLFTNLIQMTGVERCGCLFGMRRMAVVASLLKNCLLSSGEKELVANIALSSCLEMMCQVFIRCDEGLGEDIECLRREIDSLPLCRPLILPPVPSKSIVRANDSIHKTTLHPSWYVGDGILLPPVEAFRNSHRLCNKGGFDGCYYDVFDIVNSRGAYSLSLRMLCESSSVGNCCGNVENNDSVIAEVSEKIQETTNALAERHIGGTGTGITCSAIDSQQAVSFLWLLPRKQALDVYKSCLPTALKTRNFDRLFILSNIGMVAGSGDKSIGLISIFSMGWKNQDILFDECSQLASKTKWWTILCQIGVDFDPLRFADPFAAIGKSAVYLSKDMETKYAVSLLPSLLLASSKILGISRLTWLTFSYAETFGVPLSIAASKYIESLLSPTDGSRSLYQENHREERLLELLHHINLPSKRIDVLRRCLQKLEGSGSVGKEYELFNLVLRLYRESLLLVIENDHMIQSASLEAELDAVDRRRDALAILSAFFQDNLASVRPRFSSFFEPFAELEGHVKALPQCGILGKRNTSGAVFDPLEAIETVFATFHDKRAVTALAPLCIPLRIPNGYINARALVAQFQYSHSNNTEYPSFDGDVFPVLSKIGSFIDKANLAEWCANQFNNNDSEKLKCLDALLQNTIQASTEIESRRRHFPEDVLLRQQERDLLENVKRITAVKATLSDFLHVKKLLISSANAEPRGAKLLTELLVFELDRYIFENPEVSPEALIDFMYISGSHIASLKYLNHKSSFSVVTFRQFCSIVHSACKEIAEQYSHIDLYGRIRHLAHRWLFYGDDGNSVLSRGLGQNSTPLYTLGNIDEEVTREFVNDSSTVPTSKICLGAELPAKNHLQGQKRAFCIGKNSALGISTARELSEYMSHRSALCIAFVMGSSVALASHLVDEVEGKENVNTSHGTQIVTSKRMGLLSQRQVRKEQRQDKIVLERALELLQIAFAKLSVSSDLIGRFRSNDSISSALSEKHDSASTITFAMRHRALLAASILCPQEALDEIVRCEGFLRTSDEVEQCTLQQCLFGVFVAKEIEEIGLPLPHSDLLQLSSMNFSSYARALWRDHRSDGITERSNERFLLLLVEMSLQNEDCDLNFLNMLLNEIIGRKMYRTLLICLEHIVDIVHRVNESQKLFRHSIQKATHLISDGIILELSTGSRISSITDLDKEDEAEILRTVERLFVLISSILDSSATVCLCTKYLSFLSENVEELSTIKNELTSIVLQAQARAERASFSQSAIHHI